jgi:NADPH-dependent curcumin reductase CurA
MDARRDLSRCRRAQQRDGRRRYRRSGGVEGAESCARRHRVRRYRLAGIRRGACETSHQDAQDRTADASAQRLEIGKPKAGETVVVSAAAGSVGSIVGQIAEIRDCHVVGIAGGRDKCHWLTSELGFDAAVDYKDGAVFKQLKAAAPKGIDVYFDNVGGEILEACLPQMNNYGRIACCGAISQYDGAPAAHGPRGVPGLIVVKRLIMQGFIVMDFMKERDKALADLQGWVASGKLKVQEDVIDGLENTPKALIGLLAGENRGKRMIKV